MLRNTDKSYGSIAKFFHWTVALLVIVMIIMGISFGYLPKNTFRSFLMQIHKSLGVTILILMVLRLLWHLISKRPKLPSDTKIWELHVIQWTHALLYATVIAMPITGILMSRAAGYPVHFWWFATLRLNWIPKSQTLSHIMHTSHTVLAWVIGVLIVLHGLAALKHHFINKDNVLNSMMPSRKKASDYYKKS